MRRYRWFLLSAGVVAVVLSVLAVGCGPSKTDDDEEGPPIVSPKKTGKTDLKELVGKGKGTLTGRVTLDGATLDLAADNQARLAQIEPHGDKAICKMGDVTQQRWKIGKDGGIANAFVWLRPPEGQYFKLEPDQIKPPEFVELRQPHCAFIPHALTLFPSYYDPTTKTQAPTGQKLKVFGSPEIAHNANLSSQNPRQGGGNLAINKGGEAIVSNLKPDPNVPVSISCDIHKWMNATLWVLDHPYITITDADGNYKIENVPTDVPLQVVAWHEVAGWLTKNKSSKGDTVTLTKDPMDFKVPAPK